MAAYSNATLREAYISIYENKSEVEELSLQMIENAAYVLFSQGYDVDDVISYFTEATENTIIEDFVSYSEGRVLLESVVVSDAYIEEQFEILNEGLLDFAARQGGRLLQAGKNIKNALTPAAKAPVKNYNSPLTTTLAQGSRPPGAPAPSAGKPNLLQRAAKGAKDLVMKIPGAKKAAEIGGKIAKSPVGRLTGKIGSRVLPGLGVAAYGADAVSRAKKGDWGGAALSGLGAAVSAVPGAGTIASLAPAGVQMATDALGWTGDKSRKTAAPTAPKSGMVDTAKGKRYKSSSDGKLYANYNDALAARNSRLGKKPAPAAPAAATPAKPTPAATPAKPTASAKPTDNKAATNMDKWKAANPKLAAAQAERERTRGTAQTSNPLMKDFRDKMPAGSPTVQAPEVKDLGKGNQALTNNPYAGKTPEKKKQPVAAESFDIVLEYLIAEGYADTNKAALAIMSHMSDGWKNAIMSEGYQRNPEKGETPDRSREAIPGQAPRGMPPRGNADREAFEKWYRLQQASKKTKSSANKA